MFDNSSYKNITDFEILTIFNSQKKIITPKKEIPASVFP
jgi:hypothetical protein